MNLLDFIRKATEPTGVPFKDLGRDWSGWNCWGLIGVAYRELKDLELPDFNRLAALQYREAEPEFAAFRESFRKVSPGRAEPVDIILFRGEPCHVGLVVKKGLMLHVEKGIATCVEPYDAGVWPHRLLGVYRHAG
ncbi:MAG: NlpC/P60 family protein [Desulfobaccales bacterium]